MEMKCQFKQRNILLEKPFITIVICLEQCWGRNKSSVNLKWVHPIVRTINAPKFNRLWLFQQRSFCPICILNFSFLRLLPKTKINRKSSYYKQETLAAKYKFKFPVWMFPHWLLIEFNWYCLILSVLLLKRQTFYKIGHFDIVLHILWM